ncbi:MAG TPA: hypothetical protein ENK55_00840 [Actinobacteria bacterium]|nr:hypothetical protein [Actinomycetota bacterium]
MRRAAVGEGGPVEAHGRMRCGVCGGPTPTSHLACPACGARYCVACIEEHRRAQWAGGEAATISCRACGGILLTPSSTDPGDR